VQASASSSLHPPTFRAFLNALGCDESFITETARQAGWLARACRKISPAALLHAVCFEGLQGSASCNDLAARLPTAPSKQAVARRLNAACLGFFQSCLAALLEQKLAGAALPCLHSYQRVLLQDSTVLQLPAHLFGLFSGVSNSASSVCNARIQAVYDLKNRRFLAFSIDAYSKNDLLCAPELQLHKADLVLRDRGYLKADELQRHLEAGADCIYRHKTGTVYLDALTCQPIDLLRELRKNPCLDLRVRLNNKARTCVRLLSAPVSAQTANLRRRSARQQMRGHHPSTAVLALMDWTVFITTMAEHQADFKAVLAVYGLRWRVEVLFKTWKSHLKFDRLHRVCATQLRIILTARLLMITALTNWLYPRCQQLMQKLHGKELSLLKLINHAAKKPEQLGPLAQALQHSSNPCHQLFSALKKYCCYDARKRKNFAQICLTIH